MFICHICPVFIPPIFPLMLTVTHFIQSVITLSTRCEVSSNERTFNPHSYYTQHSSLALSTINRAAARKSYRRKTQNSLL
jgi:hypothetical protein